MLERKKERNYQGIRLNVSGYYLLKMDVKGKMDELRAELMLDEEYQNIFKEASRMYKEVEAILPEDSRFTLMECSDKENELSTTEQAYFYKNGFMDAIKLLKVLCILVGKPAS